MIESVGVSSLMILPVAGSSGSVTSNLRFRS